MKAFLIILAILWVAYRLTPLNGIVNGYVDQLGISLEGTLLDTSNAHFSDLFSDEEPGDEVLVQSLNLTVKHVLLTFLPAIIFVGIALAL